MATKSSVLGITIIAVVVFLFYIIFCERNGVDLGDFAIPDSVKEVTEVLAAVPDTIIETRIEYVDRVIQRYLPAASDTVRDTVLVAQPIDTAAILEATGYRYFESQKVFDKKYLVMEVRAYGMTPVDSFLVDYTISYDQYFQDHYQPKIEIQLERLRRQRWYYGLVGVAVGAAGWEMLR